jgi:alpha/beta superfamily hydrolase
VEAAVTLDVRDGSRLEALVALPEEARSGLVICHPHPLYGGDMDNPVVIRVAEVAQSMGVATLRFNFRGVGASSGKHGGGEAEQEDVKAALGALAERLPAGSSVGLAGYSFGAWVAAHVAAAADLAALALIAPPLGMYDLDFLVRVPSPTLLVAGTKDQHCPVAALRRLGQRLGAEVEVIEGAEHFFFGKLFPLGQAVERWMRRWAV